MARNLSTHRATTVGPKTPLCQVILKNTSAVKEASTFSHGPQINRSRSLLITNSRIPVLVPPRAERLRLEALLADVWTKDVLPFPGITTRSRSEQLVRASASSVMRRLSSVHITGNFIMRSASLNHHKGGGGRGRGEGGGGSDGEKTRAKERPRTPRPTSIQKKEACLLSQSAIGDGVKQLGPGPTKEFLPADSDWGEGEVEMVHLGSVDGTTTARPATLDVLCPSSANSSPCRALEESNVSETTSTTDEPRKARRFSMAREHQGNVPSRSHRLSGIWAGKSGIKHREVAMHSIRSFFR